MEETSRDTITNRLSQRMNFDPNTVKHQNGERPDSFYHRHHNFMTTTKPDHYLNQGPKETYIPNACQTPAPVNGRKNHMMPLTDTDDLRKPINYKNINKITEEVQNHYYTENTKSNENSEMINKRIQSFDLMGSARAFPFQKGNPILPDNKPKDTRQGPYGTYG